MSIKIYLLLIFAVALVVRFLYFPNNIYFGFDQARDAFAASEILQGHLKILGPPTSFSGLFHGSLYYYFYASFYFLGRGDPNWIAAFLRVLNGAGIFLVFAISTILFNKKVGIIAAILFAFSFEQSQFAIYLNHPSFGVISVLIFYLGLTLFIFKKKKLALVVASLGLGLSMQFEFILTYLITSFILMLIIFRNHLKKINSRITLLSVLLFILPVSTYLIAEVKFHFKTYFSLPQLLSGSEKSYMDIVNTYFFEVSRMVKYNLTGAVGYEVLVATILGILLIYLYQRNKTVKKQLIFLSIWFSSALTIYIVQGGTKDPTNNVPLFYPNMGVSVSLLILMAYLINLLWDKFKLMGILMLALIIFNNLTLIIKINPDGSMSEINVQSKMLLTDEERVLDYIYRDSNKKDFAVKAISMPYLVNTVWSYLFSWYGQKTYGYLPVWGQENAPGYPGNLKIETAQDKLPDSRYLIIEPLRGIPAHIINNYLKEESYFTKVVEEKKIGAFVVQKRIRI